MFPELPPILTNYFAFQHRAVSTDHMTFPSPKALDGVHTAVFIENSSPDTVKILYVSRHSILLCNPILTPPELEHSDEVVCQLAHKCTVWKNGNYWITEDGIQAMVQVTEENHCVSFAVTFNEKFPSI